MAVSGLPPCRTGATRCKRPSRAGAQGTATESALVYKNSWGTGAGQARIAWWWYSLLVVGCMSDTLEYHDEAMLLHIFILAPL